VVTFPYGRWQEREPFPLKVWHQLVDLARYPRLLRRAAPDLVHLNSALDRRAVLRDLPFALLTRLHGKPLFIKWHGSDTELLEVAAPIWRRLVGALLGATTALGVLSTEEEAAVLRHPRAPRCHVVRNPLDLRRYDRRFELRTRLGVSEQSRILLFIGRLISAKGLLDVLRALPDVRRAHAVHLVVVGEGPMRDPARALARDLGLESFVHFTGAIPEEEALDYYCGSEILILPTYHIEGFPMAVFQSVAAGLGIVTTRIRAAADYLREPEHCLFVQPRDPAGLARALNRLLADRGLLERMRRNNRALALRFERGVVTREFASIYDEMLGAQVMRYDAASSVQRPDDLDSARPGKSPSIDPARKQEE
jgi:glycosyltransferase involved in cell wall biosynthesis